MTVSTADPFRRSLDRQRAAGFPAFAGAEVRGRIPLTEAVLNEAMRASLRGRPLPVEIRGLRVLPDNRLALDINVRVIVTIPATVTGRLDPGFDMRDGGGVFTITLEGIAAAISPLLKGFASDLPPGITFQDQQIVLSPRQILAAGKSADLADLIRRVAVSTETGVLFLDFLLSVPDTAATRGAER